MTGKLAPIAVMAVLAVTVSAASAQAPRPNLSGMWEHSVTSRPRGERPQWTALGQRLLDEDRRAHWHDGVSEENTFCLPAGMPFMMSGSEGFDVVQGPSEVVIINEERPSPRHIYTDGRQHPAEEVYDPTSVGHSIGHWDGDTLVVDTTGFKAGATVQFVRSEKTHLAERYQLQDGGQKLHIHLTWTDADLLSKPYDVDYFVERAPAGRDAQEYYCDPRDPARALP